MCLCVKNHKITVGHIENVKNYVSYCDYVLKTTKSTHK